MKDLERALGYAFRDAQLAKLALTHPSHAGENGGEHNQRLEFLGDAVLQLTMSERLYRENLRMAEGQLSRLRARSVNEAALCVAARGIGLGGYLLLGHGEDMTGGRDKPAILADAMEAVLGAVYLDGGLEAARGVTARLLPVAPEQSARDHKTELQEKLQLNGGTTPCYRIAREDGPPHRRIFTAEVLWDGRVIGEGSGASKKVAEQEAARAAMENCKID